MQDNYQPFLWCNAPLSVHCVLKFSQYRPGQSEPFFPATFHQRHSENLSERQQRVSLPKRHCLLHSCLPLTWIQQQHFWWFSIKYLL